MTMRQNFTVFAIIAPLLIMALSVLWSPIIWLLVLLIPIIGLGVIDMLQTSQSLRRLYPVLGHFRYMLESFRPEIQQYFVESETSGAPIAREFRSLVYQRAKGVRDTRPFGTVF